jgi:glycosyltransferase involved in cell wall biosynthesis
LPDTPSPASPVLEKAYYPGSLQIIEAVRKTMQVKSRMNPERVPFKSSRGKFDITVIMPALNEEKNIQDAITNTIKAFGDFAIAGEIIVVNDGSSDRTEELAGLLMKTDDRIKIIKHDKPCGIGASFWDGVDNASGDIVVMLPGDNENDPWEIFRYYKLLEHVDMVIPFIFNKETRSIFRNGISYLYRFIINTTFLVHFNYTNGTVIYRKSILKELDYRSMGFFFQTDILIRTAKKGYLFSEVPYRLGLRKEGISKAVTFPSLLNVVRGYLRLVRDYYFKKRDQQVHFSDDSLTAIRRDSIKHGH